jgi:multicomponent Na+:H+ antiporter subunit C
MNFEDVLGLYNYWIVIFLMMTGFYIVIARENFIKTVIGLNIFQISVILLYVTMGKVDGGTAPIVPPEIAARYAAQHAHGDGHDSDDGHGAHGAQTVSASRGDHQPGWDKTATAQHLDDSHATVEHHVVENHEGEDHADEPPQHKIRYADVGPADTHLRAGDLVYSNPLPCVLMLTAMVVGVATTALALALIVRIREDYGTIEENEVLEMDRRS